MQVENAMHQIQFGAPRSHNMLLKGEEIIFSKQGLCRTGSISAPGSTFSQDLMVSIHIMKIIKCIMRLDWSASELEKITRKGESKE